MNLVSIIIPFYKKKEYIADTIASIISQTYDNYEILIIYDETNKENLNLLRSLEKKYNKIKIILNDKNYGAGLSRNIGIKESKGEYIAFLDADDKWHEDKLKIQIDFMIKKNILASHTSYEIINEKGSILSKRKAKNLDYENLIKSCDIGLSSVVIKKDILDEKNIFPNLITKEDYVLWLKLAKKGIIFHGIDKSFLKWRKLKNSLSSSIIRKLLDGYKVYNKYLKFNFIKSLFCLLRLSLNYFKKR